MQISLAGLLGLLIGRAIELEITRFVKVWEFLEIA
jgi:hypothetical protein